MNREENKFIEPMLVRAGSDLLRLGHQQNRPKVDCRVLSEENYQILKRAYDSQLSNTIEKEELEWFASIPWCYKCDPVQAGRTMATTGHAKYKCSQCGHTYEVPTPSKD